MQPSPPGGSKSSNRSIWSRMALVSGRLEVCWVLRALYAPDDKTQHGPLPASPHPPLPTGSTSMFMPELILSGGTASCYPGMALVMFIAPDWKDAEAIHLYTDASGTLGFGGFFNGTWMRGNWQPHQQLPRCSIPWQELFTILGSGPHLVTPPIRTMYLVSL